MLEGFDVVKDCRRDGLHLAKPVFVVQSGKAGQTHELAGDGERGRAGNKGRAPLGDARVEEDKDRFVELGTLLAVGESLSDKGSGCSHVEQFTKLRIFP